MLRLAAAAAFMLRLIRLEAGSWRACCEYASKIDKLGHSRSVAAQVDYPAHEVQARRYNAADAQAAARAAASARQQPFNATSAYNVRCSAGQMTVA